MFMCVQCSGCGDHIPFQLFAGDVYLNALSKVCEVCGSEVRVETDSQTGIPVNPEVFTDCCICEEFYADVFKNPNQIDFNEPVSR